MKKLLMMLAMAVGLIGLAAQNDPLMQVAVEKGATYDVLCKGEKQFSFTSNSTGLINVQGVAAKSMNAADYQVNLLSTEAPEQDANGDETSGSGDEPSIASITDLVCRYADGKAVLNGERCVLVKITQGATFKGFAWNGVLVDSENNFIVKRFVAAGGKFDVSDLGTLEEGVTYELIVFDTRLPQSKFDNRSDRNVLCDTDENGSPKLVCGWAEVDEQTSLKWTAIKLGDNVFCEGLDFDPTSMLEQGYAAVYGLGGSEDTNWYVFPTPPAYVTELKEKRTLDKNNGYWALRHPEGMSDSFDLEAAYSFNAFRDEEEKSLVLDVIKGMRSVDIVRYLDPFAQYMDDPEKAQKFQDWYFRNVPFFEWNADFEVSFDGEIEQDSVILAGAYDYHEAWGDVIPEESGTGNWAGSSVPRTLATGERFRLLTDNGSYKVYMTYAEICTKVQEFLCGVYNDSPKNYGKTITVRLNLYQTKRNDVTGAIEETGLKYTVGTYEYTFRGPLDIEFAEGYNWPGDAALPEPNPLHTNHNGRLSFVLPAPTYTEKHDKLAFVGWSNDVDKTIMTYIPTNTWKAYKLYGTWKPAQTVVIKPDEEKPGDSASIKVADEWLEENLKDVPKEDVAEALQKPAEDGGKIPLWQTYVLGLNPSGTVSTVQVQKETENKALVVSTVEAPAPDSGFKVRYSLDKIESDEATIRKEGQMQEGKDITIDLDESTAGEIPTGYYKMNVIIMPEKGDGEPDVDKKVKVPSEVTVGVLQVATEEPVIPVAVPWTALSDKEANIPADQIVQPQGLEDGVLLHVYDEEGKYKTLKMSGGKWTTSDDHQIDIEGGTSESDQANAVPTVKRGSAMWLDRTGTDMSKPFYLMGQYNDKSAETQIVPPTEEGKTEYNLIAPTGIEETDLNTIETLVPGEKGENDKLMIVNNGNPVYCDYDPVTKKWGYNSFTLDSRGLIRKNRVTDGIKVTAGTGLWYISAGGSPTITWTGDAQEDSGN